MIIPHCISYTRGIIIYRSFTGFHLFLANNFYLLPALGLAAGCLAGFFSI
jgi:hypothetical protein